MTTNRTVSTERLEAMLDAEIPIGMSIEDARSIITELLALRTQEPAEWQVEAACREYARARYGDKIVFPRDFSPEEIARSREDMRAAIRAASIPPAAQQETVGVKPLEWHERVTGVHRAETIVGDYRVWTHHEADGVVFWQLSDGGIKAAGQGTEEECFAAAQADYDRRIRSALEPASHKDGEAVPWACLTCNSPRTVDPCPKCGTALTKPADGWEWPGLPDIGRIRELAREVGYAIGVHGSLERDLDLIAAPWVADAVGPMELAEHIAYGLGGNVVDFERQDKPCGRWSCNIHTPDWTKMIDLSVMPPTPVPETITDDWQPIETAPKDRPIIGWCVHEADPYHDETTGKLTDYGCWAEALSRVPNGPAILEWGGEDSDYDEWSGKTIHWPNWWFRVGSEFEETANPTHWMPLPPPPAALSVKPQNGEK